MANELLMESFCLMLKNHVWCEQTHYAGFISESRFGQQLIKKYSN